MVHQLHVLGASFLIACARRDELTLPPRTKQGFANAFGVFQTYYQANQLSEYSHSDISWIGSLQLALVLACAILVGKAFDAGYVTWLLAGAACCWTAGCVPPLVLVDTSSRQRVSEAGLTPLLAQALRLLRGDAVLSVLPRPRCRVRARRGHGVHPGGVVRLALVQEAQGDGARHSRDWQLVWRCVVILLHHLPKSVADSVVGRRNRVPHPSQPPLPPHRVRLDRARRRLPHARHARHGHPHRPLPTAAAQGREDLRLQPAAREGVPPRHHRRDHHHAVRPVSPLPTRCLADAARRSTLCRALYSPYF